MQRKNYSKKILKHIKAKMFRHLCFRSFLCCFFVSSLTITTFAEDSLSTKKHFKNPLEYKKGRFQFAMFPVASIDPASGIELGLLPVFSISPRKDTVSTAFYRSSSLSSHLTYSTKNWTNIRTEGQFFTSKGNNYVVFFQFLNAPDYFYGIGNDTINRMPSKYQNRYVKCGFDATKSFKQIHFLGIKCELLSQSIKDIEHTVLSAHINGYSGGNVFGFGPLCKLDTRNNVHFPSKGSLLQVSIVQSFMLDNSKNQFAVYSFDYRKYVTCFKDYFIAFQGMMASSTGDVPFYKLPTLGGKYNLRGISNKFMYIDNNVWYTQA